MKMPWLCIYAHTDLSHAVATTVKSGKMYCRDCLVDHHSAVVNPQVETHTSSQCHRSGEFSIEEITRTISCIACQTVFMPMTVTRFCTACYEFLCDNCDCPIHPSLCYTVHTDKYYCIGRSEHVCKPIKYAIHDNSVQYNSSNITFACPELKKPGINLVHNIEMEKYNTYYHDIVSYDIYYSMLLALKKRSQIEYLSDIYPQEYAELCQLIKKLQRILHLTIASTEQSILFQTIWNLVYDPNIYDEWYYNSLHLMPIDRVINRQYSVAIDRLEKIQIVRLFNEKLAANDINYINRALKDFDMCIADYIFIEAAIHNIPILITRFSHLLYAIYFNQTISWDRIDKQLQWQELTSQYIKRFKLTYVKELPIEQQFIQLMNLDNKLVRFHRMHDLMHVIADYL